MSEDFETLLEIEKEKIKVIECDNCKKEFLLVGVDIKEIKVNDTNTNDFYDCKYFKCQECGEIYIVSIVNQEIRNAQKDYVKFLNRIKKRMKRNPYYCGYEDDMKKLARKKKRYIDKASSVREHLCDVFKEIISTMA